MRVKNQQLEHVLSIKYLLKFKKSHILVQTLIDSGTKVNAMTPAYVTVLGLYVCVTDVGAQNIDGFQLLTYGMIFTTFQLED